MKRLWRVWKDGKHGHALLLEIKARPLLTESDVRFVYEVSSEYALSDEGLVK